MLDDLIKSTTPRAFVRVYKCYIAPKCQCWVLVRAFIYFTFLVHYKVDQRYLTTIIIFLHKHFRTKFLFESSKLIIKLPSSTKTFFLISPWRRITNLYSTHWGLSIGKCKNYVNLTYVRSTWPAEINPHD